jgi:hypothetical protein
VTGEYQYWLDCEVKVMLGSAASQPACVAGHAGSCGAVAQMEPENPFTTPGTSVMPLRNTDARAEKHSARRANKRTAVAGQRRHVRFALDVKALLLPSDGVAACDEPVLSSHVEGGVGWDNVKA